MVCLLKIVLQTEQNPHEYVGQKIGDSASYGESLYFHVIIYNEFLTPDWMKGARYGKGYHRETVFAKAIQECRHIISDILFR